MIDCLVCQAYAAAPTRMPDRRLVAIDGGYPRTHGQLAECGSYLPSLAVSCVTQNLLIPSFLLFACSFARLWLRPHERAPAASLQQGRGGIIELLLSFLLLSAFFITLWTLFFCLRLVVVVWDTRGAPPILEPLFVHLVLHHCITLSLALHPHITPSHALPIHTTCTSKQKIRAVGPSLRRPRVCGRARSGSVLSVMYVCMYACMCINTPPKYTAPAHAA